MTAPTPPMMPSAIMSLSGPSGIYCPTIVPSQAMPSSIHPMGICPKRKVAENITNKSRMKMGKPTNRLVMMRSMRWVT